VAVLRFRFCDRRAAVLEVKRPLGNLKPQLTVRGRFRTEKVKNSTVVRLAPKAKGAETLSS
jgi:hypothetical protein